MRGGAILTEHLTLAASRCGTRRHSFAACDKLSGCRGDLITHQPRPVIFSLPIPNLITDEEHRCSPSTKGSRYHPWSPNPASEFRTTSVAHIAILPTAAAAFPRATSIQYVLGTTVFYRLFLLPQEHGFTLSDSTLEGGNIWLDALHITEAVHEILAERVWGALEKVNQFETEQLT